MPPNERWRCLKIVAPPQPNREQELIGGLQNALSRGENINKAKQSFISAGYKPEEIESAAQKLSTTPKITQSTSISSTQKTQQPKQPAQSITTKPKPQKKTSKKFIIILALIGILVLTGSLVLGFFWDKIFP
jgi:hypothetical protein